jgi:hypothetical protein
MEGSAYLLEIIAALAYLVVGGRLLDRARRTGEAPERLLGLYIAFTGVSYLLYELPLFLALPAAVTPMFLAGRIVYALAIVPLALFMRRVFHPGDTRASWLVWACVLCLFAGLLFSALAGDLEGMALSNGWFWVEWIGYTAPFGWVAIDSLRSFSSATRRARIGLCEAVVVNRYLLWAIFGALQVASCLALLPMYSIYAEEQVIAAWADALVGGLELASLAVLWFVFFPPIAYRRWLSGDAASSQLTVGT